MIVRQCFPGYRSGEYYVGGVLVGERPVWHVSDVHSPSREKSEMMFDF